MPTIRATAIVECRFDTNKGGHTRQEGKSRDETALVDDVVQLGGCTRTGLDFENCILRNEGRTAPCCFRCNRAADCSSHCDLKKIVHSIPVEKMIDITGVAGSDPLGMLKRDVERQGYELKKKELPDNGKKNPLEENWDEVKNQTKPDNWMSSDQYPAGWRRR